MSSTLRLTLIRIGGWLLLTALPLSLSAAGGTLTTGGGCSQQSAADTSMFVRNLDPSVTEEQLREAFSQFGVVSSVTLARDPASGNSRGLAYVEMPDALEGCDARRNLHNTEINGKAIEVLRNPGGPGINTTGGFQSRAQPGATLPMAANPPPANAPTPVDTGTVNPSVPDDPTPSSILAADADDPALDSDDAANADTTEDQPGADATDSEADAVDDEMIEEELDEEIADDDTPIADENEAPEGDEPAEGEALDEDAADAESAVDDEPELAEDDAPADEQAIDGGN